MTLKDFLNKISIRDFCCFWDLFNKYGIEKIKRKEVLNTMEKHFLSHKACAFYYGLFAITLLISLPSFAARQVPHLRLAIGEYECLTNGECENGYCDIESHVCVRFPDCPDCPECNAESCEDYCPVCPEPPTCNAGEHLLDNECVQCVRSSDCAGSTPYCNPDTNECEGCPADFPKWNGKICGCADGMYMQGNACVPSLCECKDNDDCTDSGRPICDVATSQCVSCSPEKPYWDETLKECTCPLDKPYWNNASGQCEPCPDSGTYDRTKQKCVIMIAESGFSTCPWGPAPGCKFGTNKFGPYTHSYDVYVSGIVDDEIRLYVNSTNIYSAYNSWCNEINGLVHAKNAYGGSLSNYKMGRLEAGDYGQILIYSSAGCIYWKDPGKTWLELSE